MNTPFTSRSLRSLAYLLMATGGVLESLALLIADLNSQVRALQQENAALREQAEQP